MVFDHIEQRYPNATVYRYAEIKGAENGPRFSTIV
jgi:hypothetical protein